MVQLENALHSEVLDRSPVLKAVPPPGHVRSQQALTALLAFGPLAALLYAIVRLWGHGFHTRDAIIAVVLYAVIGHGVTIGFHRLFSHRGFRASRPLKIVLAIAGSMSFQGAPIPWVANHRRHHAFADREGDPHSPLTFDSSEGGRLRGLWHAHMGWLFSPAGTSERQYAPDLLADRDLVMVNRLFPVWCVVSLAIPFAAGWLVGGTLAAGGTALLWAGGVRVALFHQITWSVNSVCHTFGRRPFATRDRSTNVAWLSLVTLGESWHNSHHAFPRGARHGRLRRQWDSSARLIRTFELFGWARDVHWSRVPQ